MKIATLPEIKTVHGTVLYLDGISVSFDGFKALNKLTLTVDAGELRCVIGPNGAGKTTMMDVITGKTRPDSGTVYFGQTIDLTKLTDAQIAHQGIGRKFQKPTIFERLSAFENLELAMKADKRVRAALFAITAFFLLSTFLFSRWLVSSKFGRVLAAIRDAEPRAMFCGYNTVHYKVAIFTLSAVLCGIAGALYVPQVGIINPSEMSPANSIEIAIWVAVGGRGTLAGAILGAGLVNGAKSFFTVAFPEYWLFALGAIFIAVTLFLPRGVLGLIQRK